MSARQNVSVHVQCTMFQRAVCNVYHARLLILNFVIISAYYPAHVPIPMRRAILLEIDRLHLRERSEQEIS
jgi:hypothetical protein